jgi:erythritol kinase (D-erythritol 1-phosphate-forming)
VSTIGLDLGTSRVKAVRFSDDWRIEDSHGEPTTVSRPHPGWSEQHMESVWQAASRALAAVAAADVSLVAVTAQGDGCWLVDAAGEPVRPAILWNDNRAASQVDEWEADGTLDRAFRYTGCDGAPGLANAQLRWLAEHEPAALDRASALLSCSSWVFSRLTGERVQHVSDLHNPFLDACTGRPDDELLACFGLPWARELLPPAVTGSGAVHPLRGPLAEQLGLPAATSVVLAPYDVVCSAIGVGAVRPGDTAAILGTTLCVTAAATGPRLDRPRGGMSLPVGAGQCWQIAYATLAGTQVLDWMTVLLGLPDAAALFGLAGQAGGTELPLLLPYLSPAGERAPFRDSAARGALIGLTHDHGPAELARATVDGLTVTVLDCLRAAAVAPTRLALSGGGAHSDSWCQILSDATGLTVTAPDIPEPGARGAALAGAVSQGRYADLEQACAAAVRPGRSYQPRVEQRPHFEHLYRRLLAARAAGVTHH